VLAKEVHDIRI
jgi:hypothetical protein